METRLKPRKVVRKKLRCFISAPFGCNTDPIAFALEEVGVKPFRIDESEGARTVVDSIRQSIAEADFVCAFFPRNFTSTTTFFELGAAVGAGVSTLIMVESGVKVPVDLVGLPTVQVDLANPETFRTAVRGFVSSFEKPLALVPTRGSSVERKISPAKALVELHTLAEDDPRQFEEFVANLFREAGFNSAVELGHEGVDMALWVDRLGPTMGNLVLVEVKFRKLHANEWNEVATKLRHYLLGAGSLCGVLVTRDCLPPTVPAVTPTMPLIMTFSVDELITLMGKAQFTDTLIARRNLAVHGKMG
jgi:hypothetical protein